MNRNGARAGGKLTQSRLNARRKRLYIMHGRGVYNMVDNKAVQEYLHYLMQYMHLSEIAERAGIPVGTVSIHAYEYKRGTPQMIQRETQDAILSVRVDRLTFAQRSLGMARMIGGLKARGYTVRYIASQIGLSHNTISRYQRTPRHITQELYDAMLVISQRLERENPARVCDPRQVKSMRTQAKNVPPIGAWDLDTIHLAEAKPDPKWRLYNK